MDCLSLALCAELECGLCVMWFFQFRRHLRHFPDGNRLALTLAAFTQSTSFRLCMRKHDVEMNGNRQTSATCRRNGRRKPFFGWPRHFEITVCFSTANMYCIFGATSLISIFIRSNTHKHISCDFILIFNDRFATKARLRCIASNSITQ